MDEKETEKRDRFLGKSKYWFMGLKLKNSFKELCVGF